MDFLDTYPGETAEWRAAALEAERARPRPEKGTPEYELKKVSDLQSTDYNTVLYALLKDLEPDNPRFIEIFDSCSEHAWSLVEDNLHAARAREAARALDGLPVHTSKPLPPSVPAFVPPS